MKSGSIADRVCACGATFTPNRFEAPGRHRWCSPRCYKRHYMREFRKRHPDTLRNQKYHRWRAHGCCGWCGTPVTRFAICLACRRRIARSGLRYYHRTKQAKREDVQTV